jgi:GNAT superfamily N-acetyltransferase
MSSPIILKADERSVEDLIHLIVELAKFERLAPPDDTAIRRLREHALAESPQFEAFIAYLDEMPVGYITYYFTYSTFLAKPTLFLEDIFVLEQGRKQGVGKALFHFCAQEARRRGCGRMEWSVLAWNEGAISFYEGMGGKRLDWYFYRLDEEGLDRLVGDPAASPDR